MYTPERVAISFMAAASLGTVALGTAVAFEVSRPAVSVQQSGAASALTTPQPGTTGTNPSAQGSGSAGTAGTVGTAGTAGTGGASGSASQGVNNGVITVGGIYDETGPVDATVERDTVRSYFDEVNAAGGVNGYHLKLVDCDSQYSATVAHQCSLQLQSQGILAFVGSLSVNGEQPETPYQTGQGIPVVGGLGVPSEFQSPLSFPVVSNFATQGTAEGNHAKALGIHHPGIVLLNVDFVQPALQALLDALHKNGIQEVDVEKVDTAKPDYTDVAFKLKQSGADSIIAGLDPFSYARFFQALNRIDWHPTFFGSGLDKKSAEQAYGSAVYGAQSLTPILEPDEHMNTKQMAEYYGAVQKYYPNQVPALDVYSEGDWLAAKVFVQAIARIGNHPVTRQSLAAALESIRGYNSGLTPPTSYSHAAAHDPDRCFQWTQNNNGTWHTYSGWNCF